MCEPPLGKDFRAAARAFRSAFTLFVHTGRGFNLMLSGERIFLDIIRLLAAVSAGDAVMAFLVAAPLLLELTGATHALLALYCDQWRWWQAA